MQHEVRLRTSSGVRQFTIGDAFLGSLSDVERANSYSVLLYVAAQTALLADSPLGPNKPPALYKKFLRRVASDGVKATIVRFTGLAHKLVSQVNVLHGPSIGPWLDGFRDTPVFKEYHEFYRTGNVSILRWLYTFLNFGKKLEFVDPSFNETAFRGWTDNEKRLNDLILPSELTASLQKILSVSLPTFSITDFRPKFGPGSVAERGVRRRLEKIKKFSYDATLDRIFFHGHVGKYGYGEDCGLRADRVIPDVTKWSPASGVSSRISKLMFVPKNIKTARSICMEPSTLMFFQQGVLDTMLGLLRVSKLAPFVRLKDQSFNRKLSQIGSETNLIDTLDLSSASDCLSYDLVKKIFPPSWQIVMRATRSYGVELPDGSCISVKKFAPMGSALCFPTQCITFWAVCIYAACRYTYDNSNNPSMPFASWLDSARINWCIRQFWQHTSTTSIGFQPLGIYGDDICIDSRLTDIVKSTLTALGFVVNEEKSFVGSQSFRESCGGFYMRGHDITPLYFSVKGVQEVTNPEHVASHVHVINECWNRRYKTLYRFLHHSIMTWDSAYRKTTGRPNPIPHVTDPNRFGILCSTPVNNHLQKRENRNLQRSEIRSWIISYTVEYHDGDLLGALDSYEHMRWWASHRRAEALVEDSSSKLPYDTGTPGLVWRWIPDQ